MKKILIFLACVSVSHAASLYHLTYITHPYQKTINHSIMIIADDDSAAQILADAITVTETDPTDITLHTIGVESGVERVISLDYDLTGHAGEIPHVNTGETGFVCHDTFTLDELGDVVIGHNLTAERIYLEDSGTDYLGWTAGDSVFKFSGGLYIGGPLYVGDISGSDFTGSTIDATDYIETPIIRNTDGDTLTVQDNLDVTGTVDATAVKVSGVDVLLSETDPVYLAETYTEGSVVFGGSDGYLTEDNAKLFWDDSNNRLGIGTNTPERTLHIQDDNGVVRIDRDTNSPAFILARFPNNDYATPWKTFIFSVVASGPDEGMFQIADMHQNVSGANDKRFTIISNGDVGIGTVTPSTKLEVSGTITATDLDIAGLINGYDLDDFAPLASPDFTGDVTFDATTLFIDSTDNRVGVGTIDPKEELHIASDHPIITFEELDGASNEKVWEMGAAGEQFRLRTANDLHTGNQTIWTATSRGGTSVGIFAVPNANTGLGTNSPARALHVDDVMRLDPRSSAPSSPSEGDIYYDGTLHKLRCYNGSSWQNCF